MTATADAWGALGLEVRTASSEEGCFRLEVARVVATGRALAAEVTSEARAGTSAVEGGRGGGPRGHFGSRSRFVVGRSSDFGSQNGCSARRRTRFSRGRGHGEQPLCPTWRPGALTEAAAAALAAEVTSVGGAQVFLRSLPRRSSTAADVSGDLPDRRPSWAGFRADPGGEEGSSVVVPAGQPAR
jgi:hypothetical protein